MKSAIILLSFFLPAALAAVDLSSYPLSAVLREGAYILHWSFDVQNESIRFAVNVSTSGWVGFGLSPTGGMTDSDVIIGWVDSSGQAFLQDRYAFGRSRPSVDPQQNWILEEGLEESGFTVLTFFRDWVTCDELDRDIMTDTSRVIFSWNNADPPNNDPNQVMNHGPGNRGTMSLNLLGGQQEVPPDPADLQAFDITVDNITIPSEDTTYWCSVGVLPQAVMNETHYMTKVAPVITPGNEAHVHHILIYECSTLNGTHIGYSAPCNNEGEVAQMVQLCRGGVLLAGWAVGGTEFVYPAEVAYPIGGPNSPHFFVMETHYDNQELRSDISDSSGMKFSYTSSPRTYDAGVLLLGHDIQPSMIIPPGAENYTVFGECSSECTMAQIPEGGINVFANTLHTHLAGISLTVHHIRRTELCDNELGELKPLDQNLQYDFNFQQTNHLPEIINVQPGDILRLECVYNTEDRTDIVLGGGSTFDEMCLSFLSYYPRVPLTGCVSTTPFSPTAFQPFLNDFVPEDVRNNILMAAASRNIALLRDTLNQIQWSTDGIELLQSSVLNGPYLDVCVPQNRQVTITQLANGLPEVQCKYQAIDKCDPGNGARVTSTSVLMVLFIVILPMFSIA